MYLLSFLYFKKILQYILPEIRGKKKNQNFLLGKYYSQQFQSSLKLFKLYTFMPWRILKLLCS